MKVIVLGAGVIGTACAYYLSKAGHEVTVIDRRSGPARWAGLRPMTPDGPPYLGATPVRNLLLNLGQGSNGWTQACGCGRIVGDIVSGRAPDIDLSGLMLAGR
jgi:glycine/D-amino acid oxidase-like deaminating enzyme